MNFAQFTPVAKSYSGDFPLMGKEKRAVRLEDLEPTVIAPSSRRGADFARDEPSVTERAGRAVRGVNDLAQEFLDRMQSRSLKRLDLVERTRVGSETFSGFVHDPVKVGFWGILIWGGGFLQLGFPVVASLFLIALLCAGTVFGALTGILPAWISGPLLRDLQWTSPLAQSLLISGATLVSLWWLSIVIPVGIASRSMPGSYKPAGGRWRRAFLAPIPVLGMFLEGKFWRAHLHFLSIVVTLSSGLALRALWRQFGTDPLQMVLIEPYLWIGAGIFLFALVGFLFGVLGGMVRSLRLLGWVSSSREFVESDPKFVGFGVLFVLVTLTVGFFDAPGRFVKAKLDDSVQQSRMLGLPETQKALRSVGIVWEKVDRWAQDQKRLLSK